MDLALSPAQEMLKSTAHDFVERECPTTLVQDLERSGAGFSSEIWRKMAQLGWVGLILPEQYGGGGGTLTDLGVLFEEMGRGLLPSPLLSSGVLCGLAILEGGTPEQKERILPAIARGDTIVALALTEPDYGWGADSIHMTATARNGGFVLNGTKLFIPDVQGADQLLCVARTRSGRNPEDDITMFLVDKGAAGLSSRTVSGFTGDVLNEVVFNGVEVPQSRVVGQVNRGWSAISKAIEKAIPVMCAYMVGGCAAVFDLTVNYARTRIQFGVPIGTFQRVQDHVINLVNHLDAARWTTYEALWKVDENKPDASEAVAMAKVVASEGYHQACFYAHEVHGGFGTSREYSLHLYTKKARTLYEYLGDPAYHRKRLANILEL